MKRVWLSAIVLISSFTLTGCTVNWFDKHYDVPWYIITVPVVLIIAIIHIYIVTRKYECPKCGTVFRPKWYDITTWLHANDERVCRCPKCKRKGFCKRIK